MVFSVWDEAKLKLSPTELSGILATLFEAQGRLTGGNGAAKPSGFYTLTVSPDLQRHLENDSTDFTRLAQDYVAQVRHPGSGQIVGISTLRQLLPEVVGLAGLTTPQALAASVTATVVLDSLESINMMHAKLDSIQKVVDALHSRHEAKDNATIKTALKEVQRIQRELMEHGLTEADRRENRQELNDSWRKVGEVMEQDKVLLRGRISPKKPEQAGRRLPTPQLPITVQFPVRLKGGQVVDDTLPMFTRLIGGLVVKTYLLSTLELTELKRGLQHRERELQSELEEVQKIHRDYRLLWAQRAETIQGYGVDVNAQFEVAEQLEKLARGLEVRHLRPPKTKSLVLETGENGQVKRLAALV